MRTLAYVSVLCASLVGLAACLSPTTPSPPSDTLLAIAQVEIPPVSGWRYTRHPASSAPPEIVLLRIEGPFTAGDRARIVLAVAEWNHVLNGFVQFHLVGPNAWRAGGWVIRAEKGGSPQAPDPAAGQPLSFTQVGFASIGGQMVIYIDRIGTRDLRGVVLHELGHVLGLGHDVRGNLMSARYAPTIEQCVDEPTAQAIASLRKLPLAGLNWCEADITGTGR